MPGRKYDIVVFGCTGNAGSGVALRLLHARNKTFENTDYFSGNKIRVAFAGRTKTKIEALRTRVCSKTNTKENEIDIIVADATDSASMLAMTKDSKIVISCAGPFGRYGEACVKACVEGGCHYVDITGEVPWVNSMINKYDDLAKKAGVTLLPFSGYDCIPAELAMVESSRMLNADDCKLGNLELVFSNKSGGFPKGTLHTMIDGVEHRLSGRGKKNTGATTKPFVPRTGKYRLELSRALGLFHWLFPSWSRALGGFVAPNFMSAINAPVLYHAASSAGIDAFGYQDRMKIGSISPFLLFGLPLVFLYQAILFLGGLFLVTPCFRWWIKRRLKTYSFNGDENGYVKLTATAISVNRKKEAGLVLGIPGDAGIFATGSLAAASSIALLRAESESGGKYAPSRGFGTPATALRHGSMLVTTLVDCTGVKCDTYTKSLCGGATKKDS